MLFPGIPQQLAGPAAKKLALKVTSPTVASSIRSFARRVTAKAVLDGSPVVFEELQSIFVEMQSSGQLSARHIIAVLVEEGILMLLNPLQWILLMGEIIARFLGFELIADVIVFANIARLVLDATSQIKQNCWRERGVLFNKCVNSNFVKCTPTACPRRPDIGKSIAACKGKNINETRRCAGVAIRKCKARRGAASQALCSLVFAGRRSKKVSKSDCTVILKKCKRKPRRACK